MTVTVKVQEAELPASSEKVYVTTVLPTAKNEPGAWLLSVKVVVPELSVAVGSVQVTVVPPTPVLTVVVISLMQAMVGGVVSTVGGEIMEMEVLKILV